MNSTYALRLSPLSLARVSIELPFLLFLAFPRSSFSEAPAHVSDNGDKREVGAGQIPVDEMCINRTPHRYSAHAKLLFL